jgi:uncharacterized protein CbrC (UPF0167 family)
MTPLPTFKYHPDPLKTESIIESDTVCKACGQARGFIYTGPVYAEDDLDDSLCPWCIADGTAHSKFEATFTDAAGIGGYGEWEEVPANVIAEVSERTPGFLGWQQEQWFTHCNDAAAFLGRVGYKELKRYGAQALDEFREATEIEEEDDEDEEESDGNGLLHHLDKDGSPTGYLFKCLHCGKYGGYTDTD